jgi:hypothetical protein
LRRRRRRHNNPSQFLVVKFMDLLRCPPTYTYEFSLSVYTEDECPFEIEVMNLSLVEYPKLYWKKDLSLL